MIMCGCGIYYYEYNQIIISVLIICFWAQTHYVLLLCSFKEQLQQHVRVHAMEAVMACWDLDQSLKSLTGGTIMLCLPNFIT
jgi:KNOX2 domain